MLSVVLILFCYLRYPKFFIYSSETNVTCFVIFVCSVLFDRRTTIFFPLLRFCSAVKSWLHYTDKKQHLQIIRHMLFVKAKLTLYEQQLFVIDIF